MKNKRIILALAAVLISFSSFSQTVKDVNSIILEINLALLDNDADLITLGDIEPDFKDVGYYQNGSEIVRINCNVLTKMISEGTSEESVFTCDLRFYYQNDELIYVEMKETMIKTGQSTYRTTNTNLYFSNGELLTAQKEIASLEYETVDDTGILEQRHRFVERAEYLLDKIKNSK